VTISVIRSFFLLKIAPRTIPSLSGQSHQVQVPSIPSSKPFLSVVFLGRSFLSMDLKKTVAIIGAGPSGLTAIKACMEEDIVPVCFERENSLGGLWKFSEEDKHSSVYKSTVINTSKEMSSFSDFPMPKRYPFFPPHTQIMEYFHLYASHFDLYKYISFDVTVTRVCKANDYATSGKWSVSFQEKGGKEKAMLFDGVLVCSGHLWYPSLPSFHGMDNFERHQMHSHSYKYPDAFKDKKVLIVGKCFWVLLFVEYTNVNTINIIESFSCEWETYGMYRVTVTIGGIEHIVFNQSQRAKSLLGHNTGHNTARTARTSSNYNEYVITRWA